MNPFTLTVIMYHYVRDPGDGAENGSGIPGLPVAYFEAQLDQLTQTHSVIRWPDLRDYVLENKPLPPSPALITFDDGVHDHYLNAFPALARRGLSGLFFGLAHPPHSGLVLAHKIHFLLARLGLGGLREAIWNRLTLDQRVRFLQAEGRYQARYGPVDVLKGILQRELALEVNDGLSQLLAEHVGDEGRLADAYYLTAEQISEMTAGGMHFGGHTRSHPWFDWIDADAQTVEIQASADWLSRIEPGPWAFAYPYGGLSQHAPPLLKSQGFAAAFTTKAQVEQSDPYYIGRLDGEELSMELTVLQQTAGYS